MEELILSITKLEAHLLYLQKKYGDHLNEMRDMDGQYILTPILVALVNGYAAVLNKKI